MIRPLRVLTWNVYHCRDGRERPRPTLRTTLWGGVVEQDGYVHLNRTLTHPFADLIRRARPDICLLQEVPPAVLPELARHAGMSAVLWVLTSPSVGPVGVRAHLGERNPDLWRTHRGNANAILLGPGLHPILGSARNIHLNPRRVVLRRLAARRIPLAAAWPWLQESRRAVVGRVRTPGGGEVAVACVHLHSGRGEVERHTEVGRLAEALRAVPGPLIVAGDVNMPPDHPALVALTDLGLDDPSTDPRMGIDRILTRGLEVAVPARRWLPEERDVPVRGPGGRRLVRLSDHDPVDAVVRAPEGAVP